MKINTSALRENTRRTFDNYRVSLLNSKNVLQYMSIPEDFKYAYELRNFGHILDELEKNAQKTIIWIDKVVNDFEGTERMNKQRADAISSSDMSSINNNKTQPLDAEALMTRLNEDLYSIDEEMIDKETLERLKQIVDKKLRDSIWDIEGIMKDYAPYLSDKERRELERMVKNGEISPEELLYAIYVVKEGKLDISVLELIYGNRELYGIEVPEDYKNSGNAIADLINSGIAVGSAISRFGEGLLKLGLLVGAEMTADEMSDTATMYRLFGYEEQADKLMDQSMEHVLNIMDALAYNMTDEWKNAFYNSQVGKWAEENAHNAFKQEGRRNKIC